MRLTGKSYSTRGTLVIVWGPREHDCFDVWLALRVPLGVTVALVVPTQCPLQRGSVGSSFLPSLVSQTLELTVVFGYVVQQSLTQSL